MFNDRHEVHNNTMEKYNILGIHTLPWAHAEGGGGGARIGVCPPPPLENQTHLFAIYGWPFSDFFSLFGLFATFFYLWGGGGGFHHVIGLCALIFSL